MKEHILNIMFDAFSTTGAEAVTGQDDAAKEISQLAALKCIEAIMLQVQIGESITGALKTLGFDDHTANEALKQWAAKY